jgi:hypothetical protein
MRKQTYSVMPSERSSTPPTRPESPAARSVFSEEDCPLDPDSSSAFWRSAPVILLTRNAYGEPLGDPPTEVRSRWTRKSLYVIFTCPYETLSLRPDPVTSRETNRLWEWDVAEVFIRPDDAQIRRYKEFEVSPQGEWVDVDVDLDSPNHEEGWVWTSEMEVASRIDREHKIWNGAMRIPFLSIDPRPAIAGNVLRANFFRWCALDRTSVAWIPTMKPTFHVPEVFGTLLLDNG